MKITILTIFPEYFATPFATSILKRAQEQELAQFCVVDLRQFTTDKRQTTDDRPFGGGPGMVMKIEPIFAALESLKKLNKSAQKSKIVLTSAKGSLFTQQTATNWSQLDELVIICGHYEGVDERVAEHLIDEEVRVGDFVMTGGEPAALVISDVITRLLPGVLGNELSNQLESHTEAGVLGFPQYTRPETFNGWDVPAILLSGAHALIQSWRKEQMKDSKL